MRGKKGMVWKLHQCEGAGISQKIHFFGNLTRNMNHVMILFFFLTQILQVPIAVVDVTAGWTPKKTQLNK